MPTKTAKTGYWRINKETGEAEWIEGSFQPPKPDIKELEPIELPDIAEPLPPIVPPTSPPQPPGSDLPPEAWKELNDPSISSEEWLAKWEAPVRVKELEPSLRIAFPEMFDPTRSFGFTEEQLPGVVIEQLLLGMAEDFPGFVQDLTQRVGRYEAENILRQFGAKQEDLLSLLDVQEQEQRTLNLIQSVIPEAESIESFSNMIETDWESFFETVRLGGMTSEKRQLLELIGLDPIQINEIAMRPRLVVDIDGIRKLTDVDLLTKTAFDLDGNYIGMYNPATQEFTKASPRNVLQKTWDWISFSSRQYWELGESFAIGVLPELIYPEVPEGFLGGLGKFMNETNNKQRENWRFVYGENKAEYEDWLRKNSQIKPSIQYQEGALKNPELLKDPMYYVYEFTNILPLVLATAAIGVGTGGVGVPFFALSTGMMGAVEGAGVYEDLLAAGAPEDKAALMAALAGGIIGSLESVGRIPLLKQISPLVFGKFKREAARELARQGLAQTMKKFGRNFTLTMFSETLTEVAQEIVGNAAVKVYDENRSIFENVPDIAVKTAVGMLGFGLFGAGVSVRMVKPSELRGLSELARKAKGWVQDNKGNWYEAIKSERGEFVPGAEPGKPEGPSVESEIVSWQEERKAREAEGADRMELAIIDARIRDLRAKLEESKLVTPEITPAPEVTKLSVTETNIESQIRKASRQIRETPGISEQEAERQIKIETQRIRAAIPKAEAGMPEVAKPVEEVTPEKAANIRLEKYPEEVRPLITEWVETHGAEVKEATRGIVSDVQVRAEAEKLTEEVGGDLAKLRKKWKPATAWNAEELVAIRSVLRAKTQEVIRTQKAAKENNSTHNLLKLELALKEQAAVQEMVHGLTAEAGRALRSFRQEAFDAIQSNDVSRMDELLSKIRGRENTEKIIQMLGQLDPSDPVAVNRFIQELYKPHVMDYLIEIFYNSILSGSKTHIVNSLSNTANAIFSPVERFVSALVDMPLAKMQGRTQERFLNEVSADIFGAIRGIPEGFRQFAYVIKNGISFEQATKWEFRQKAFKGKLGAAISMPSRFLEGADALMKAINQRAALNAEAHRIASKEKLKGQVFEDRVAELISSPTRDMLQEANRVAEYRLFRQPPGKFGQTLMTGRDAVNFMGIKPLRFVIPFIRTPMNLVKFGLERTPLGFINAIRTAKREGAFTPEVSDQIARAMIGSVGLAALSWYFAVGMITGAPPRDRAERDRFYREGKQPYAIRVGGFWVSYQRLEPFNQLLGLVAILADAIASNEKGIEEKIADAANTFGQNFISQTYMSSISDLLEMLAEPERYAGKWLNRFASSMLIPMSAATRTAALMFDQVVREPANAWETIEASIPGLSTRVKAKLTVFGEAIERKSPQWFPINITPVEETILSQELERLEFDIGFAGKTISGVELSEDEQREYQILSGQLIKKDLEKLMVAPEYWQATDIDKDKMLRKVVDAARDWARSKMREKMWVGGTPKERMEVLGIALIEIDSQLGKVISAAPEFTHEEPNVYDLSGEMDNSYKSLLGNIPEEALKGVKVPATVKSWYAKNRINEETSVMPNKALISLSAKEGTTFEDYYTQWQKRSKITDARELAQFDKDYPNANLGNMSKRQIELLRGYHKIPLAKQTDFLAKLTEADRNSILNNSYKDWMESHPRENAELAIWNEAKLLTKESYEEYIKLIKQLDIPDSALPKNIIPENLDIFMIKTEKTYREIAKKFEATQYLDDTVKDENGLTARERARVELKSAKIGDMTWIDVQRKIEAIEKGTDDKPIDENLVKAHVEYGKLIDQIGSSSAEAMLFRVDNPDYDAFRTDTALWDKQALTPIDQSRIPIWRIDVKWREQDTEYEAIKNDNASEQAKLRAEYLEANPEYRMDRRRREGYSLTNSVTGEKLPVELVESYVAYYEYPDKGFRRERFLVENPDFAEAMNKIAGKDLPDPAKVPSVEYDNIYDEWRDEFENPNAVRWATGKQTYSGVSISNKVLTGFGLAEIKRKAYGKFIPNEYIDTYVQWRKIQSEGKPKDWEDKTKQGYWLEDDWFLMENKDFYNDVYIKQFGNERKDFRKVPSRLVFEKYLVYVRQPHQTAKKEYRAANPDLEEWGQIMFGWTPIKEQERRAGLSPREKFLEEFTEKQAGIEERL